MKNKHFSFLIIIVAVGSLVWTACQKNDLSDSKTADDRSAEKFFNSYTSSKPAVTALQQYAQRKNEKLPFASKMIRKAGIPRWDKALVFENVKTTGRGDQLGENTTVIHVPMVPENGNMVQGSLMVRMSAEDTVMNLVAAQDYASYGFGAAPAGGWNAHDVFTVLTKLDNMVFGRTTYWVTDGRMFGDSQQIHRKVSVNHTPAEPPLAELFTTLTVCNSQTVCIIAGDPGSGSGACNTYTYCTTYYIEIPDGGGGGGGTGGTGGTGGGPTGGGGTGGTGGTGGVGGWIPWDDEGEEVAKYADLEWYVYYIPQTYGGGLVTSTDRFFARFNANHPERNRFTSGAHLNNRVYATDPANFACGTWGVTINSNTLATTVCGGTLTLSGGVVQSINNSKTLPITSLNWLR